MSDPWSGSDVAWSRRESIAFSLPPTQIANAAGIATIGAAFFAIEAARATGAALLVLPARFALLIAAVASFLSSMRHEAPVKDNHHDSED